MDMAHKLAVFDWPYVEEGKGLSLGQVQLGRKQDLIHKTYGPARRWPDGPRCGIIRCSNNRDQLLPSSIAARFLGAALAQPKVKKPLSTDHFWVDGTLIEAWAPMKSVKPKDGSGEPPAHGSRCIVQANFQGQTRTNDTNSSTTDPDARLYRKGKARRRSSALHRTWADGEPPLPARRRLPRHYRGTRGAGGAAT